MALNLHALHYITEVAKTGSITKAAQNLLLTQPYLSTVLNTVEKEIGTQLFRRSFNGVEPTEAGVIFIQHARNILANVETLESMFYVKPEENIVINVSAVRAYTIMRLVADLVNKYADKTQLSCRVHETNPFQVVEDVRSGTASFGCLTFFDAQQEYFINLFKTHGLSWTNNYSRKYVLAMSADNPLCAAETIDRSMLKDQIVVLYEDYESSGASFQVVTNASDIFLSNKRIYVTDRSSAMEALSMCPGTYMWISGVHPTTLTRYNLVTRECEGVEASNIGCTVYYSPDNFTPPCRELFDVVMATDWASGVE